MANKNNEAIFVEQNKRAVLEELSASLNSARQMLSETLPEVLSDENNAIPPIVTAVLLQLNTTMGYTFALYNELQTLEYGFSDEDESRPIGFASLTDQDRN